MNEIDELRFVARIQDARSFWEQCVIHGKAPVNADYDTREWWKRYAAEFTCPSVYGNDNT